MKYSFEVFADYFQIYVEDSDANLDVSSSWTPDAIDRLLAFDPNQKTGFVVGTVRNMDVRMEIEVFSSRPVIENLAEWDQINECSINIPSGILLIRGLNDHRPEFRLEVKAGTYRARLFYRGLNSLSEDGLDGDDFYRLVLYPAAFDEMKVLKQRKII